MAELVIVGISMLIYLALCGVFSGGNNNQKFGDGKDRYDFKDYVNKKVDNDLK